MYNVAWLGVDFGNIGMGEISEKEVPEGGGKITFEADDKEYITWNTVKCEKHKRNTFTFTDATFIQGSTGMRISVKEILNAR
jgi:hypothetical protein